MADMLKPSPALLAKLGSALVHAQEYLSDDGHDFDRVALHSALADSEVKDWLTQMDKAAMIPKRRRSKQARPGDGK